MSRKTELVITISGDIIILSLAYFLSWKAAAVDLSAINIKAVVGNVILVVFWLLLFQTFDLYLSRSRVQLMDDLFRLLKSLALGIILMLTLGFLVHIDFLRAPRFIPTYIIILSSLFAWRLVWRGMFGEYFKPRPGKVAIFQNGEASEDYQQFKIVRKVSINKFSRSEEHALLKEAKLDGILIESNGKNPDQVLKIISGFADKGYEIFISPKLYPLVYQYFLINKVADSVLLKVIFHPLSSWDRFLKRVIDIILSSVILFMFMPLLLVISLFIKVDAPGPVLYKQKRVGFRGREFILYKFRSMVSDAEKHTGPVWAEKNDRRITRIGKIMRPLRFDELPQLINVLKGDMSFVGPRPERQHFVENLRRRIPLYGLRLSVHPGVTGLAQVRHNYDRTIEDVKKKLEYDLEYINRLSLRLDLKIFMRTILTVIKKQGAH
jgi:exopolysaccharide biosynthesis polyprenyl glycosylphosphotransferase